MDITDCSNLLGKRIIRLYDSLLLSYHESLRLEAPLSSCQSRIAEKPPGSTGNICLQN